MSKACFHIRRINLLDLTCMGLHFLKWSYLFSLKSARESYYFIQLISRMLLLLYFNRLYFFLYTFLLLLINDTYNAFYLLSQVLVLHNWYRKFKLLHFHFIFLMLSLFFGGKSFNRFLHRMMSIACKILR